MSAASEKHALKVEKTKLLIVEGEDERLLFSALLKHLALEDVQVLGVGGKSMIKRTVAALVLDPNFSSVKALAVVRDADFAEGAGQANNAAAPVAFRSVCDVLAANRLAVPPKHGVFAPGPPRTAVFILPDGESDGMLEDLCLTAFTSDPAHPCMDRYFTCLTAAGIAHASNRIAKARMHALLASRREPEPRLGMAAQKGHLDFSAPAFGPLVNLLRALG